MNLFSQHQERKVVQLIRNNNAGFEYKGPPTFENDFIILKLGIPLELNDDVKHACLPDANIHNYGIDHIENVGLDECFTSGWGALAESKQYFFKTKQFIKGNEIKQGLEGCIT